MYARIQTTDQTPDRRNFDELAGTIAGHPGFAGLYALAPVDGEGRTLVTLWDTEDDARRASDRTTERLGPRSVELRTDLLYEVRDDDAGASAGETPQVAALVGIRGPMSEEKAAVGRRVRREKIMPVIRTVPGGVRFLSLFQPDTQEPCTLSLVTSVEVGTAIQDAVAAVELAPDEEWAIQFDRREFYSVEAAVTAPAATAR